MPMSNAFSDFELQYSNIPLLHHSVLPVSIPLFQHSIIPLLQQIKLVDNGVPLETQETSGMHLG